MILHYATSRTPLPFRGDAAEGGVVGNALVQNHALHRVNSVRADPSTFRAEQYWASSPNVPAHAD